MLIIKVRQFNSLTFKQFYKNNLKKGLINLVNKKNNYLIKRVYMILLRVFII